MDLSHDLGGVWYLEVLWLARPNLPRQSAIANQNPLDHVPVPDIKCWFRPCASLMPTIYRAMGLDAASNRYPPDIQHGRHTKVPCLRSDKFPASLRLRVYFWGVFVLDVECMNRHCHLWLCGWMAKCSRFRYGKDSARCEACKAWPRGLPSTKSSCSMQTLRVTKTGNCS